MVPQPKPQKIQGFLSIVLATVTMSLLGPSRSEAQTGPRILHDGLRCVLAGEHLILQAYVEPDEGLTTVKGYFRANVYSQFYYVEMARSGDLYQGVLPKPSPEIDGLVYYIEAMDSSFNSVRTAEFTPQVVTAEASCEEQNPTPAVYLDGPGAITVGSTGSGPGLPAGFLPEGIVGTIEALGRSGGGNSGLIIGSVAAGGAAVGAGILAGGGDDPPAATTSAVGGVTTTSTTTTPVPTTTSAPSSMVVACFETSPSPPRIPVGGTVRFDATCTQPDRELVRTYDWDFNDGRGGREGRVVSRVYNDPGVFGAVLTVTTLDGATGQFEMDVVVEEAPAPPPGGGGTPGPPSTADVELLASGSLGGSMVTHTFTIRNNGPLTAEGVTFSSTISGSYTGYSGSLTSGFSSCTFSDPTVTCTAASMAPGASFTVTVTVTASGSGTITSTATSSSTSPPDTVANNNAVVSTVVPLKAPPGSPRRVTARLTSHLELPPADGATQSQITFNEARVVTTDNSGPSMHDVPARTGENVVEGFLTSNPSAEGLWRFDFRGAEGFEPGSIVVETGHVVSTTAQEIVFRVAPGVRHIRFRYRLGPASR